MHNHLPLCEIKFIKFLHSGFVMWANCYAWLASPVPVLCITTQSRIDRLRISKIVTAIKRRNSNGSKLEGKNQAQFILWSSKAPKQQHCNAQQQSQYIKVTQGDISIEHKMRFGLVLASWQHWKKMSGNHSGLII